MDRTKKDKMSDHTTTAKDSITFTIPQNEWISSNDRLHHHEKARKTAALRARARAMVLTAISEGLLPIYSEVPLLDIVIGYPSARKADPPNAYPTVKAIVDGCTDAGLWEDDNSDIIHAHLFRRNPERAPKSMHTVTFTFVSQEIPF